MTVDFRKEHFVTLDLAVWFCSMVSPQQPHPPPGNFLPFTSPKAMDGPCRTRGITMILYRTDVAYGRSRGRRWVANWLAKGADAGIR